LRSSAPSSSGVPGWNCGRSLDTDRTQGPTFIVDEDLLAKRARKKTRRWLESVLTIMSVGSAS
jgi:hypothetical protein